MPVVKHSAGFCQKGYRNDQEDALHPGADLTKEDTSIWVVCDGVGGHACGEQASKLVSTETASFLLSEASAEGLGFYLRKVVSNYVAQKPECKSMSTTLTFLQCREQDILLGWCGDSRIYHFRAGKILFRTTDHSLVHELVDQGELTEEEAREDSRNNIITRAIGLESDHIDFHQAQKLQPDDYFLLCTDGVIEALDDKQLREIFVEENNLGQIRSELLRHCEQKSTIIIQAIFYSWPKKTKATPEVSLSLSPSSKQPNSRWFKVEKI